MADRPSARQLVLEAFDKAFQDSIGGVYNSVLSKVAGGQDFASALREFDISFIGEVCEEHDKIIAEATRLMDERGVA